MWGENVRTFSSRSSCIALLFPGVARLEQQGHSGEGVATAGTICGVAVGDIAREGKARGEGEMLFCKVDKRAPSSAFQALVASKIQKRFES